MYGSYVFYDKKTVGSVRGLIKKYGIRYNSYAGEVIQRVFHYYFGDAINLKKEYRKYYMKEYAEFDKYLECHLGIPLNIRKTFSGTKVYYVDLDDKGDKIGDSFFYEENLKEQFWNLVGGLQNENSRRLCDEQFFD